MVRSLLVLLLCAATTGASAQYGLQWGAPVADRSGQLVLAGWTVGLRVHLLEPTGAPLRVIGDHYLTGPGFGGEEVSGGLRLSGGLTIAARQPAPGAGPGLSPGTADTWRPDGGLSIRPYLGLGYSTLWVRSGWGFAADIGLGGLRPGIGAPRLGAAARGNAVEQVLESLRMAPVLQLGVSYAF